MNFRSPILRKLLLAALALILVALGSAAFLVTRYTAAHELQHAQESMDGQIRILAPSLTTLDPGTLPAWTKRAGEQSRARVTVIERSGRVLSDSQYDASAMENHAGRPEIRDALSGHTGIAVRHSATLDADLCYLAVPASIQNGTAVVLRLAVPLSQIQVTTSAIRGLIFQASLIALLWALLLGYILSRLLSVRIRRIQSYARELVNADYSGRLDPEPDDELGSLARSLREMAEQFRHMLRRLSEEAGLRKAILGSMVEGVIAVDRELRLIYWNGSFCRALSVRQPLAANVPLYEVVRDPALLDLLRRVILNGEPLRMRLTLVGVHGRVFEVQAAPISEGPGAGAIAILHEVTEVEQLERVRKDFVANISHDLRTPLAAIQGYAETLLSSGSADQENNRKFLEIIRGNAVRLGDLAADLLTLSELETERVSPPDERIAVRSAISTVVGRVEEEVTARNVHVVLREGPDMDILGPPMRFEQALMNLLRNAIKFNQQGGAVYLETAVVDGKAQITIRDTGIGIPSTDLPRIFERSYCVDKARTRENGGTGLGLAIVKHIVGTMHGSIAVESQLGKGTKLTLRFPIAD